LIEIFLVATVNGNVMAIIGIVLIAGIVEIAMTDVVEFLLVAL
jgi:hypothetical protein